MLERLTDGFPMKLMGGILFLTFEKQLAMLLLFGIMIFLDCFTRWIAISHAHLVSCGRQPTFLEAVCGIREARRRRLISSEIMKKRGTEKLILYNLCVAAGIVSDALLQEAGPPRPVWQGSWSVTLPRRKHFPSLRTCRMPASHP